MSLRKWTYGPLIVAPRVGHLHLNGSEPRGRSRLREQPFAGVEHDIYLAERRRIPLEDGSLDFAFSLGVLHQSRHAVSHQGGGVKTQERVLRFWFIFITLSTIVLGGLKPSGS